MAETRDLVAGWLAAAGLVVSPLTTGLPSNAEWGLVATTPPPFQVKLRLTGLRNGAIVLGIGIQFAEEHRREIARLKAEERVRLAGDMLRGILSLCPYCRVALQGGLAQPVALVAEVIYFRNTITQQRLVDDVARLVNIFIYVNTMLIQKFPHITGGKGGEPGAGFM